jgi:AcrR family transcriptional regulator
MQNRSIETRARIIESAMDLFAQKGFEVTSVADICEAAGVSKGAFYHHFPSKQAIFQQGMEEWVESIDRQLALVRETGANVPEALAQMTHMMPEIYQAAMGGLPMFLEFLSFSYRDPEILQAMASPHRRFREFFTRMIQEGIDEGSLGKVDPDLISRVIVALAIGLLVEGLVNPDESDWSRVAEEGIKLLTEGLNRR